MEAKMMKGAIDSLRGRDYQRPRRPNPDTIAYLRSLPFDVKVTEEEISHFLNAAGNQAPSDANEPMPEYPQSFAAALSALDEVQNEIASLAGDELSAEIIEILARITAPYSELAARKLLYATSGYAVHLATHRYGSHVFQTILQLAVTNKSRTDLALHSDSPTDSNQDGLPSIVDLLMALQDELAPHAGELAVHICGTHVLRTLVCVLAGVELRQSRQGEESVLRRGKAKANKKKKKRKVDNEEEAGGGGGPSSSYRMLFITDPRVDASDSVVTEALNKLTVAISGDQILPPGSLQQLACNPSGGPLLSVLLRALSYRGRSNEWSARLNAWETDVVSGVDRHLGLMRPEPHFAKGSEAHALAERLLCWQSDAKEQKWACNVMFDLAGEPRGSHCLETILHLCPDDFYNEFLRVGKFESTETLKDYVNHNVRRFVVQTILATLRTKEEAMKVIQALEPLVQDGFLLDTEHKARSVLWRMVEAASVFEVCQESLLQDIMNGFAALKNQSKPVKLKPCVPLLLGISKLVESQKLVLDVFGTRIVHFLLRFKPTLVKPILNGILDLSTDEIELLMKDGLGSRCVIDGLLDGPVQEAVFAKSLARLSEKLAGRWVAIACDRIGHHVVNKLFRVLTDDKAREELVKELAGGKKQLSGNNMGRSVLAECFVLEYEMNGTKDWNKLLKKKVQKDTWVDEIVQGAKRSGDKRKDADDHEVSKSKKLCHGLMGVDSIFDAINIPSR